MTKARRTSFLDFFGLKRDPFSLEGAYSPVGKRHEALEQMVHLNQFSNLVIAVVAPVGYGKTVLFELLGKQLKTQKDLRITQIALASRASGMSLLQRLSSAWQLEAPSVNRETLLRQLRNDQLKRATVGVRHCIIIDNAEFIDQDGLKALQSLTTGLPDDRSIGLTLFCNESVVDLRSIFRPVESLHVIRLQALSQRDVFVFIKDHFRIAGGNRAVPLPPDIMENIAVDSEGVPLKIIALTRAYMESQPSAKRGVSEFQFTRKHRILLAAVVAAVVLGASSMLMQSLFLERTTINPSANNVDSPFQPAAANMNFGATTEQNALAQIQPIPKQPDVAAKVVASVTPAPQTIPTVVAPVKSTPVPSAPAKIASAPTGSSTPTTLALPEPEVVAETETDAEAVIVAPEPAPVPKVTVAQVSEPVPAQPAKAPVVLTGGEGIASPLSRPWFQQAAPTDFTIQVVGSHQESAIKNYINSQKTPELFDYVVSSLNGNNWYIVVYGAYATKAEAAAMILKLPETVKDKKPWIRSISAIRPTT